MAHVYVLKFHEEFHEKISTVLLEAPRGHQKDIFILHIKREIELMENNMTPKILKGYFDPTQAMGCLTHVYMGDSAIP